MLSTYWVTNLSVLSFEKASHWELEFIKLTFLSRLARPLGHWTSIFTCPRTKFTWPRQSDLGFVLPWSSHPPPNLCIGFLDYTPWSYVNIQLVKNITRASCSHYSFHPVSPVTPQNFWYSVRKHPRRLLRMCLWCEWRKRYRSPCFYSLHHLYYSFCILKCPLWTAFNIFAFSSTCVLDRLWTVSDNALETVFKRTRTRTDGITLH